MALSKLVSQLLQFIGMSEASLVVAGVKLRVSGGSATATVLDLDSRSDGNVIVPSSVFVPSSVVALDATRIGNRAFTGRSITSMLIPRHVQILCSYCFSHCKSLSSVSFETNSELTRIEFRAFATTYLSLVVIPRSTSFIAGDAFPHSCAVTLAGSDPDAEFGVWNGRRQLGSSEAFKRSASGMRELANNESGDDEERRDEDAI
jgi:hypothetical protein